jgi:hypothetical protein
MSRRWERHDWVPYVELPHSATEDDRWDLLLKLANEAQDLLADVERSPPPLRRHR